MSDEIFRSNVYCTNCRREFAYELDLAINGNHVIVCPYCAHEHYRVVCDGEVTEERWRSSAGPIIYASTSTTTVIDYGHYLSSSSTATSYTATLWANRSDWTLS